MEFDFDPGPSWDGILRKPKWTPMHDGIDNKRIQSWNRLQARGDPKKLPYWMTTETGWESAIAAPLTIPLPCVIEYSPVGYDAYLLPHGTIFGVLMEFRLTHRKPKAEGIVFVCGDQTKLPPVFKDRADLWFWALNPTNCPRSRRFCSLGSALRMLCLIEGAPYPTMSRRKDGYIPGLRAWKVREEEGPSCRLQNLVKNGVPFFPFYESLSLMQRPAPCKPLTKKRKKSQAKDRGENLDMFNLLEIPDLSLFDP